MNITMVLVLVVVGGAFLQGCANSPQRHYEDVYAECLDNPVDRLAHSLLGTKRNSKSFCDKYADQRVYRYFGRDRDGQ